MPDDQPTDLTDPPQDPPTDLPADPPVDPPEEPPADDEVAKWKAMARKHEKQAKANATELEKLRQANLSEQEKAIEEARGEGRVDAAKTYGSKLAAAELRAAGVPSEVVEDLDLSRFVDDAGEVDADKVAALGEKYAALAKRSPGSADGGPRGDTKPGQISRAELKNMTPKQIVEAKAAGRLDEVLGVS